MSAHRTFADAIGNAEHSRPTRKSCEQVLWRALSRQTQTAILYRIVGGVDGLSHRMPPAVACENCQIAQMDVFGDR